MKPTANPQDKTAETDLPAERGYEQWKRAKVERGLAEAEDRGRLIPIGEILDQFKLER